MPHLSALHASTTMPGVGLSAATGEAIFWVAAVSSLIAELAILRAVFRARPDDAAATAASTSPTAPRSTDPSAPSMPHPRRTGELVWAVLPALMLALVLVLTWRAMRAGPDVPEPRATPRAAGTEI